MAMCGLMFRVGGKLSGDVWADVQSWVGCGLDWVERLGLSCVCVVRPWWSEVGGIGWV